MKIRRGDTVKVRSGKDRGKTGKVARVFPRDGTALVEGVNLKKKHRRSRRQDKKGEIILLPAPLAASAVQVVCPACGKPTRIGYQFEDSDKKVRMCRKCGKTI